MTTETALHGIIKQINRFIGNKYKDLKIGTPLYCTQEVPVCQVQEFPRILAVSTKGSETEIKMPHLDYEKT